LTAKLQQRHISYRLRLVGNWISLGNILNAKREAKATLLQSEAYRQAVQTQVIANVANCYYTLLMLDRQLAITEETAKNWGENVKAMKIMKQAGLTNEAAVSQSEANYYTVNASIPDLKKQIRETENTYHCFLDKLLNKLSVEHWRSNKCLNIYQLAFLYKCFPTVQM